MLEQYYKNHLEALRAYAMHRVGDAQLAEDIVQDAFEQLLLMDQMVTPVTLPSLVHTIVNRRIIDYYRRRQHREAFERYLRQTGTTQESMSLYAVEEMKAWIERGINRLPAACRKIYRLHLYQGMKPKQIAEQEHLKYKTVENQLGMARKEMRRYLLPLTREFSGIAI